MRLKFSTQQCSRWNCWCILHLIYWLQDGYSVPSKYEEMRHGYPLIGTSCSLTCVAFKMVGRFLVLKQWWHQASCWEFLMWIEPIWGNRLKCLSFKFPSLPFAVVKYRNRSVKWQSDCLRIIIFNLNCRFHMKLEHLMAMLHRNLQTMSVIRQSVKFMSSLIRTSKCLILIGQLRPYVQQLLAITCVILSLVPKASWLDLIGRFWCGQVSIAIPDRLVADGCLKTLDYFSLYKQPDFPRYLLLTLNLITDRMTLTCHVCRKCFHMCVSLQAAHLTCREVKW